MLTEDISRMMQFGVAVELAKVWVKLGLDQDTAATQAAAVIDKYRSDPRRVFYGAPRLFEHFAWAATLREEGVLKPEEYEEFLLAALYRNIPDNTSSEVAFEHGMHLFLEHYPEAGTKVLREKVIAGISYVTPETDMQKLVHDAGLAFLADSPFQVYLHNCSLTEEFVEFDLGIQVHAACMRQLLAGFTDRGFVYCSDFFRLLCESKAKVNCRKLAKVMTMVAENQDVLEQASAQIDAAFAAAKESP